MDQLEAWLAVEGEQNIGIQYAWKHNQLAACHSYNSSFVVEDRRQQAHLFSVTSKEDLLRLLESVGPDLKKFWVNNDIYYPVLQEIFPAAKIDVYRQYTITKQAHQRLEKKLSDLTPLRHVGWVVADMDWYPFISTWYDNQEFNSTCYIKGRIRAKKCIGIVDGTEKIGFAWQHENGEVGGLVILPTYRGNNLGNYALVALNQWLFNTQEMLYTIAKIENEISQHTIVKSGYVPTLHNVLWVYIA